MNKKILILLAVSFIICGFLVLELEGNIEALLFGIIPYNYTSYVTLPASENTASYGGYYKIFGKGTDFNFEMALTGAEDYNDPLEYTKNGLNGTGKIDSIQITFDTIIDLISGNFKKALFDTKFSGTYNMNCAAWTGNGSFINGGKNFTGNFEINGVNTYWEGKFNLIPDGNRIAVPASYLWHPQKSPEEITYVNKTYYM
jgi:hypothetical protein